MAVERLPSRSQALAGLPALKTKMADLLFPKQLYYFQGCVGGSQALPAFSCTQTVHVQVVAMLIFTAYVNQFSQAAFYFTYVFYFLGSTEKVCCRSQSVQKCFQTMLLLGRGGDTAGR